MVRAIHYHINLRRLLTPILLLIFLIPFCIYETTTFGKIDYGVKVANINIGGMTPMEAVDFLSENVSPPDKIKLTTSEKTFEIATSAIGLSYDFTKTVERAYGLTRTGNIFYDFGQEIKLLATSKNIGLTVNLNENETRKIVSIFAGQVAEEPEEPSIKLSANQIVINKGSPGSELDQNLLRLTIGEHLAFASNEDIQLPITKIDPSLSNDEVVSLKSRAEKYLGKNINLNFEFNAYNYSASELLKFINPRGGLNSPILTDAVTKIAIDLKSSPQNPKFTFTGGRVTEFLPAKDGIEVDQLKLKDKLIEALNKIESEDANSVNLDIPVIRTAPQITTDKVNDLGIKELIGRGTSLFRGSIPSRVHNVSLAASKLNGVLIKPGDTLSFNDTLGDVSKFTGFQEAYVIRDGKTVLGDGGGVCQVSTTLFRAALNAGLPITERQAHAYRVGYYEQGSPPGLDATVYGPSPDLKIKNDTSAHILIQATTNLRNYSLTFEFYGTKDGRISEVSKPVVSKVVPAGDDIYIDDPTLKVGTLKQTEHRANGARVTFDYKVVRGGEILINKTFVSNYRPWPAVYLRGTGI